MSLIRSGGIPNEPAVSAFGEALVSQETPVTQISSEYGLSNILALTLGGTVSVTDDLFTTSTGTGSTNVAAAVSRRQTNQRPGQGLSCKFSALFTTGQPNSTQQAGLITAGPKFAFGYNGASFGVLYSFNGALEIQSLQITTGGGNETAIVTVDEVSHSVPITNSSIQENAYEISTALNLLEDRYTFTSNNDKVTALASLPDFGSGSFTFSSATAVATWTQIKAGLIATELWTPIEDWNGSPNFDIDPTKINDFKIQLQGNINFYIKNADTGLFVLVHTVKYINTSTKPSVGNPTFRIGWSVRNAGNATDVIVKGGYAATFIEGLLKYNQLPNGKANVQEAVGNAFTNILSFRNRPVFRDVANRAEIIPLILSLGTDSTKPVLFEVVASPQTTDFLNWQYVDEATSLMEYSTTKVPITGNAIAVFTVGIATDPIDMQKILEFQVPGAEFSIAARTTQGAASAMIASGTWKEDL